MNITMSDLLQKYLSLERININFGILTVLKSSHTSRFDVYPEFLLSYILMIQRLCEAHMLPNSVVFFINIKL